MGERLVGLICGFFLHSLILYVKCVQLKTGLIAVHELSSIQSWNSWPACIKSLWSGIRRSWTSRSLVLSFQSVAPLLLLLLQPLCFSEISDYSLDIWIIWISFMRSKYSKETKEQGGIFFKFIRFLIVILFEV